MGELLGVTSRTGFNSLVLTFNEGETPVAVAKQSGENHLGPRMVVSMGMRNGGKGHHRITMADGTRYALHSSKKAPSVLIDGQKRTVMTLETGDQVTATSADGQALLRLAPAAEHITDDLFRLSVRAGSTEVGELEVYRKELPKTLTVAQELGELAVLLTPTANSLKINLGGVRYVGSTALAEPQRLAIIAASVNLVIGLVPCGEEMVKAFKKFH